MSNQKRIADSLEDIRNAQHHIGEVQSYLSAFASHDGSGLTLSAVGNYSGGAAEWAIGPPAGQTWRLTRFMGHLLDTGSFDAGAYGNGIVLTNGLKLYMTSDSGATGAIVDALPIISNADWGRYTFDLNYLSIGTGDNSLNFRWSLDNDLIPVRLVGDDGDRIVIKLEDDFSGLNDHTFLFQGYVE